MACSFQCRLSKVAIVTVVIVEPSLNKVAIAMSVIVEPSPITTWPHSYKESSISLTSMVPVTRSWSPLDPCFFFALGLPWAAQENRCNP